MTTDQEILNSIKEGNRLKGYQKEIQQHLSKNPRSIVILDDDPTGTQTVQNIPVVTKWSEAVLEKELVESPIFFILTNSRSLQKEEAKVLAFTIGQRLQKIALKYHKNLLLISRSDSTLRGHYPSEVDALSIGLGQN
ncbi:MAG: four-carbon acid sugar kinase family protein, partial [Maribacter sp.]